MSAGGRVRLRHSAHTGKFETVAMVLSVLEKCCHFKPACRAQHSDEPKYPSYCLVIRCDNPAIAAPLPMGFSQASALE
jgi:hypothetical protein